MNTILQQRIEAAAKKICCTDCPMAIIRNCKGCVAMENAIKTGIFTLQNQWISVEEALPLTDDKIKCHSTDVIVRNEYGRTTSAWYDYKRKEWHLCYGEIAGDDLINSKITHWMAIPKNEKQ